MAQRRFPGRATLRTLFAALVALIPLLPEIIRASGWQSIPWIAAIAGVAATITRIMAMPAVDRWLDTYLPWLASEPYTGRHRKEPDGYRDHDGTDSGGSGH